MITDDEIDISSRRRVLTIIIVLVFVALFLRLYYLQLVSYSEFGKKSIENSVRIVVKEPVRGFIFDRNDRLVVDVGPAYSITVTPAVFDTNNLVFLSSLRKLLRTVATTSFFCRPAPAWAPPNASSIEPDRSSRKMMHPG